MCHKIILDDKLCQEDLNVHVPQDHTGKQALSGGPQRTCATRSDWMTSSVRRTLTYMCHKIILGDKLCQKDLNVHVPQYRTE